MGLFDDAVAEARTLLNAKKKPVQRDVDQDLSPLQEGNRAISTMPEPEPSFAGAIGTAFKEGLVTELPKAAQGAIAAGGRLLQDTGIAPVIGKKIEQAGVEGKAAVEAIERNDIASMPVYDPREHPVKSAFEQAARMAPVSMIPAATFAVNPALGVATTAALFGGSQSQASYESVRETLIKQGVSEEEAHKRATAAGYKAGGIETLGESLGGVVLGGLLSAGGRIGRKVLSGTVKVGTKAGADVLKEISNPQMLRQFGKHIGEALITEPVTEFGQAAGERAVEEAEGVPGVSALKAGKEAVGPAFAMTLLFAPFGAAGHYAANKQITTLRNTLSDTAKSMEVRAAAAEAVAEQIEQVDAEQAKNWRQNAAFSIDRDLPITLEPSNLRPVIEKIRANGPDFTLQGQPYGQPGGTPFTPAEQPLLPAPAASSMPVVAPETLPAAPVAEARVDAVDASYGPGDPNYQIYGFPYEPEPGAPTDQAALPVGAPQLAASSPFQAPAVPRGPISRAVQSLATVPAKTAPISRAAQHAALPAPAVQEQLPPPAAGQNEQVADIARMPLALPAGAETEAGRSIKQVEQSLKENGISPENPAYQKIISEHRQAAREYDRVTGYQPGDYLDRTMERIKNSGGGASYGAIDLRNLGGLNDYSGGEEKANAALGEIAGIIKSTVDSVIGKHAQWFRKGGDEFSVVAEGVSQAALDAAFRKASDAVNEYAAEHGLSDIAHPKGKERGVGIYYGSSDFTPKTARETITAAEDKLYEQKKSTREAKNAESVRSDEKQVLKGSPEGQPEVQRGAVEGGGNLQQPASEEPGNGQEKEGAAVSGEAPSITKERLNAERRYYGYADGRSKGLLIYLTPREFLTLASRPEKSFKDRVARKGVFSEEEFNKEHLPYLDVDQEGNVTSHEGRARAELARQAGYKKIPVVISMRDPQNDLKGFPTSITAENKLNNVTMPEGEILKRETEHVEMPVQPNEVGQAERAAQETAKKVQAITENTDRLLKEGGYMVAIQPKSEKGEANLHRKGYRPYTWDETTNALKEHGSGVWAKKPTEKKSVVKTKQPEQRYYVEQNPKDKGFYVFDRTTGNPLTVITKEEEAIRRAKDLNEGKTSSITPDIKKPAVSANTVFTDDAYAKAKALLHSKLSQVSMGLDPEIMQAGFTMAGYHIEKGARTFAAYAKAMVADLGEAVKPYLKSFYNGVRDLPGIEQLTKEMDPYDIVSKTDINEALKSEEPKPADKIQATKSLASWVKDRLSAGQGFNKMLLFHQANGVFGGTIAEGEFTAKDAFDAMEMGINQYIVENFKHDAVQSDNVDVAQQVVDTIRQGVIDKIASQSGLRTEEQDEFQQFSTIPDTAYVMAWAAHLNKNDVALEPSAGTGGLLAFAKAAGVMEAIGNEFSERRAEILKASGVADKVYTENAEQLNNILPKDVKPTVILMNPPFSSTAGRMRGQRSSKNVVVHLDQALKRLAPSGRLVALIGKGLFADPKVVTAWFDKVKQEYNLRAIIGIEGKGYKKYGTDWDNRIIVIDKTAPDGTETVKADVADAKDAIPLLKEVRDVRAAIEQPAVEQSSGEVVRGSTAPGEQGAEQPAPDVVDVGTEQPVGAGERNGSGTPVIADIQTQGNKGPAEGVPVPPEPGRESGRQGGRGKRTLKGSERSGQPGEGGVAPAVESLKQPEQSEPDRLAELTPLQIQTAQEEAAGGQLTDSLYEDYRPQKLKVEGAQPHPGKLVQSAAMASVEPPNPTYQPRLPKDMIDTGKLSLAQIEAVVYAGQAHQDMLPGGFRKGYFIGDGTGVGKGREISAIIMDNMRQGRKKALWLSTSSDLVNDARRDFSGVGGDADKIFDLSKHAHGKEIKTSDGVLFTTYSTLKFGMEVDRGGNIKVKAAKPGQEQKISRLEQISNWLGKDFDGVIVFDEAHKLSNNTATAGSRGNTTPAAQALAGVELQRRIPNARVIYVSATGATRADALGYLERLGVWGEGTPFANKRDFITSIKNGGLAAMEVVARDLKAMGLYISRSLDFSDVTYGTLEHPLTPEQRDAYDTFARAWQTVLQNVDAALAATGGDQSSDAKMAAYSKFWGSNQRFFNQIITSMQMPSVIEDMKKHLAEDKSIVLQLVNTNEAVQDRALASLEGEDTLDDLDMTPKQNLMQYIENGFPTQQYETYLDDNGNEQSRAVFDKEGNPVQNAEAVAAKERLLDELGSMKTVPDGPLEYLLNTFGAENVAEVTGRSHRVYRQKDPETGVFHKIEEKWSKAKGRADVDAFMNGKKRILVFSDAGGTGRSFHADKTTRNQQRRIHYLVQPGWRADNAVQGFGRTHRTNEASAPHYALVTTDLKGQKRFISSIARRLDQLGALTKGERKAGSQGLFSMKDNLESTYAAEALTRLFHDLAQRKVEGFTLQGVADQLGLRRVVDANGALNVNAIPGIPQFLNRLLSLEYDQQNKVFDLFFERLEENIDRAIAQNTLDFGLENYKADGMKVDTERPVYTDAKSKAETRYVQLEAKHKNKFLDFETASNQRGLRGFYLNEQSGKVWAVKEHGSYTDERGNPVPEVLLRSPMMHSYRSMKDYEFQRGNWKELTTAEAEKAWNKQIDDSPKFREERLHLITGALLPIWDRLPQEKANQRVIRVQTDEGKRYIGRLIDGNRVNEVLRNLGAGETKVDLEPADAVDKIANEGYVVQLANGWKFKRSYVSGDSRIELMGDNLFKFDSELQHSGMLRERINYNTRYFVPMGEKAVGVYERLTAHRPISDVISPAQGTQYLHSTPFLNPDVLLDSLKKVGGDMKAALPHLVTIGRRIFNAGTKTYQAFVEGMKKYLGELWNKFKHLMLKVYGEAKQTPEPEETIRPKPVANAKESVAGDTTASPTEMQGHDQRIIENSQRANMPEHVENATRKLVEFASSNIPPKIKAEIGRFLSNPWFGSEGNAHRRSAVLKNVDRAHNRNDIRATLWTRDFESNYLGIEGMKNALKELSAKDHEAVDRLIKQGDIDGVEYTADQLLAKDNPTGAAVAKNVINAYKAFRDVIEKAGEIRFARLRELAILSYKNETWYADMQRVATAKADDRGTLLAGMADRQAIEKALKSATTYWTELERIKKDWHKVKGYAPRTREDGEFFVNAYRKYKEWDFSVRDIIDATGKIKGQEAIIDFNLDADQVNEIKRIAKDHRAAVEVEKPGFITITKMGSRQAETTDDIALQHPKREGLIQEVLDDIKSEMPVTAANPLLRKVYMQTARSEAGAARHADEVRQALPKYLKSNYKAGAEYVTRSERNTATPEELMNFKGTDMAMEAMVNRAFETAGEKGGLDEKQVDNLKQSVIESLAREIMARGFARHGIARAAHLIEGYKDRKYIEVATDYASGLAGWLSKMEFAIESSNVMRQIPKEKPDDKVWVHNYVRDAMKNATYADQMAATARSVAALYYLGFKFSAVLLNGFQNFTVAQAEFSRHTESPLLKLMAAQRDVMEDYWKVKRGGEHTLSKEEVEVLNKASREGIDQAQAIEFMSGISETGTSKTFHKLTRGGMSMFQWVETHVNREPAMLAAYRVFKKTASGVFDQAAFDKAEEFVYNTHYLMGKENLPEMARSPVGKALYVFQGYVHNYLHWMYNRARDGEFSVIARSLAAIAALGGIGALPIAGDLDKWIEKWFGVSYQMKFKKFMREQTRGTGWYGDALNDFVNYGAPSVFGVDMSRALAVNLPIVADPDKSMAERIGGAWGTIFAKPGQAMKSMGAGDTYRAVESMMPEFIANPMRGYRQITGATTVAGKPIYDERGRQIRYSGADLAKKALGFQPVGISAQNQVRSSGIEIKSAWEDRRNNALAQLRRAKTAEEIRAARQNIMQFNFKLRESQAFGLVNIISADTLRRSMAEKHDTRQENWSRNYLATTQ